MYFTVIIQYFIRQMLTWNIIIKITQDLIGAKMTYLFNVI